MLSIYLGHSVLFEYANINAFNTTPLDTAYKI